MKATSFFLRYDDKKAVAYTDRSRSFSGISRPHRVLDKRTVKSNRKEESDMKKTKPTGRILDMTQGKPLKLLLTFALPLFLGNILQQFYNLADTSIACICME